MQETIYVREFCGLTGSGYRAPMALTVSEKIKALRLSLGENQAQFADRMKVKQATVSRWENGAMPEPIKLAQLAELSNQDVMAFITPKADGVAFLPPPNRFHVRGAVAAGVWREAYEWPQEEWTVYSGGSHVQAPEGMRFGLLVEGSSMNEVYPEGTVLDCVAVEFFGEPGHGQRVIVVRTRVDGEVEATVKELHIADDGRKWLVPRSNNPAFQSPIPADEPEPGIVDSQVIAVVVGSYRPE